MPVVQQVFKQNLGADFDLVSGKIVNHSVINGTVPPTVAPLVPTKNWLFVNTATDQITHYWDTVASAWVEISVALYQPDGFPRSGSESVGGVIPAGATSYNDADGNFNAIITLPTAVGRMNEIFTINHQATFDATLLGTNKSPATPLQLTPLNRTTRYISNGTVWVEDTPSVSGNITARVSNVAPTVVMGVGGLFEISMPASTDVRIRALVARSVYISSEGEYPGGSFTTSTAAIVNLTTAFVPADNNVHVAGEMNIVRVHDFTTGRIFRITVWRLAAIAGNWSGWVEEIGISTNQILTAGSGTDLTNGVITNLSSTFGFATRVATQPVTPANTFMNVVWTTTTGNQITLANTVTPFTITQAGTYKIVFNAVHDDNGVFSGSFQQQRITVNGAAVGVTSGWDVATNLRESGSVEYIGVLAAGDTVGGQVNHSTINGNTVSNCSMSIQRIL